MSSTTPDAKRMRAYRQTPEGRAYVNATNRARSALVKKHPDEFKEIFTKEYQALLGKGYSDEK